MQLTVDSNFIGFEIELTFDLGKVEKKLEAIFQTRLAQVFPSLGTIDFKMTNIEEEVDKFYRLFRFNLVELLRVLATDFDKLLVETVFNVANSSSLGLATPKGGYVWRPLTERYTVYKKKFNAQFQKELTSGMEHMLEIQIPKYTRYKIVIKAGFNIKSESQRIMVLANEFGSVNQPARPILLPLYDALFYGLSRDFVSYINERIYSKGDVTTAFKSLISERFWLNWWRVS